MKKLLLLIMVSSTCALAHAQGCVAIRSNGGSCAMSDPSETGMHQAASWQMGLNTRYFRSFRHFRGKEEQKERVDSGTEVINHAFSTEISLTRFSGNRWSFGLYIPVIANTRSSLYEHDRKNRYETHSFGLGDIRLAAYYWITNPASHSRFHLQGGLGIKLPTGDYRYVDYFHKTDSTKLLGPVDQSIQLGDGGTGITTELNAFYTVSKDLSLYGNFYYLFNPREQNGVSTSRGGPTSAGSLLNGSDVMSVPDQYMARLGGSYRINNSFQLSLGGRLECVPSEDVFGGSNGFRRPGYVVSVEPVINYQVKKTQFYLSLPYAVERNRTQSVPDKLDTKRTGKFANGDAAFADYTINVGIIFSLR
jgi:hypothetical protein